MCLPTSLHDLKLSNETPQVMHLNNPNETPESPKFQLRMNVSWPVFAGLFVLLLSMLSTHTIISALPELTQWLIMNPLQSLVAEMNLPLCWV